MCMNKKISEIFANKHHIKETKTALRKGVSQSAPKCPICQNDDTNQSLTKVFETIQQLQRYYVS